MERKRGGGKKRWGKHRYFGSRTDLKRVVDAPRRGPAAGIASRRDRWGKEKRLVNIYIKNCYFYSRVPPLAGSGFLRCLGII